jgi:hypothetical protein
VVTLANTCEGSSGTAVSTANSAGPNQFTAIGLSGAGNTLNYSATHVVRGATAISPVIGATAGAAYVSWTVTTAATYYSRAYVFLAAAPSSSTRLIAFVDSGGTLLRGGIYIDSGRHIQVVNSATVTEATSTTLIPTGAWCRVAASTWDRIRRGHRTRH